MAKIKKIEKNSTLKNKKVKTFKLIEPGTPNLYKEIFPYTEVSKIIFDNEVIPINPAKEIFITDTTFRDGQQSRPPYTAEQIVAIFKLLSKLGGPKGVIRQTEFFLYSKKDKDAVQKCLDLGLRYPEITGWIRAAKEDVPLVKQFGLKETGLLTSVSDYHIFLKLNKKRSEAMEGYLGIVKSVLDLGIIPRCHFEDITRADIYGFCIPFAQELMKLRDESGLDIKIRLCDTMGYGITYPGAALPRSVDKLVHAFIHDAGVPDHLLEWHGHNDFHKAMINATTAWLHGCSAANSTLLGLGERTGNPPIEGLIFEYIALRGNNGIDTTVITDIAKYFEKEIGVKIPHNYPFVGSAFNVTSAGVHADGLIKCEEIYNIFDTRKILNRPITTTITDKSGNAGIAFWINKRFNLEGNKIVDKRHPAVSKIHKWVTEQYESGRITSISPEEMDKKVRQYLPEHFKSELEKIKYIAEKAAVLAVNQIVELPLMRTMNSEKQEPVMQKFVDEYLSFQFAYIVDMNGRKTTKNITDIADRAKYENYGIGTDQSDRQWFINPLRTGQVYVSDFFISKMTGVLCFTVSAPIFNKDDEMIGIFGVDIKFEDWVKRAEEMEDMDPIALHEEYKEMQSKANHGHH